MKENKNIRMACKACSDEKRKEFQSTNFYEVLKKAQMSLLENSLYGRPLTTYVVKVPFQHVEENFNPIISRKFYINKFDENSNDKTEHMWVLIGDVNFESETICGILFNSPVFFDMKEGDIVVADFKDLEGIEEYGPGMESRY